MEFLNLILQISETLTTEKNEKLQTQRQYQEEVTSLSKGSVVKRTGAYGDYYVLTYYSEEIKKGRTKYIGNDKKIISALQVQIERRRFLEKELRQIREDLKTIDKMLEIANKRIQKTSPLSELSALKNEADGAKTPPIETDLKNKTKNEKPLNI